MTNANTGPTINLNAFVRVKLNDTGRAIYQARVERTAEGINKTVDPEYAAENAALVVATTLGRVARDGTIEMTLWEMSDIFGASLGGAPIPFEKNEITLIEPPSAE